MSLHSEWLSLIDVSGPFLAEPVLDAAFSTGLPALDGKKRKGVRQAYYELRESQSQNDPDYPKLHRAWIQYILSDVLEWDDDRSGQNLKSAADFGEFYAHEVTGHNVTLNPELAFLSAADELPSIFVVSYPPDTPLDGPINTDGWIASPAERMVELCRANTVRLGLITNGEHWMLIDAPTGGVTTFASWYSGLWAQEPKTLQAFITLFDIGRFFLPAEDQLPALLDKSLEFQDDVTDALGEQVRRAVEVLIQAFDRADTDRNQTLLAGVKPAELYEAGLTIMMRIVFLLSAEERDLLLLGDERYESNYAITTLRRQLKEAAALSAEIMEHRWDAWSRLLALFRAVYAGVDHQTMRLPALGGSLFDPDRFPFLEGRGKGTSWKETEALPLPIDNKTVLLLLDAVQLFRGRTLSYRALDVEQIGYVYEGLLERTAVKAKDVTLDLHATKTAKNPWVTLTELEDAAESGTVAKLLKERTGSSASRVKNDLAKAGDSDALAKLLVACQNNEALRDKLAPYIHFIRIDPWDYPLVYPKGSFMVAAGTDRRESGTHYTPKSLTEQIVETTLTPLAYSGPAEGKPQDEWKLKSPAELLDLRICDPAMGSGAFLVQVCRWLSEKLVEAWLNAERNGKAISIDGIVISPDDADELAPDDLEERAILAKRLIAERCLYGVDMNPLAVELAKLSIWLVTLSKGRPFGFLDHNLKAGDSLLGITSIEQLTTLTMQEPEKASKKLFAHDVDEAVQKAIILRTELRAKPVNDIRDVEVMASLDAQAKSEVRISTLIADALIGETLASKSTIANTTKLSVFVGDALAGHDHSISELVRRARQKLSGGLPAGKKPRIPFHWPLEFPEVFNTTNGFDAIVGNPPFLGGQKISGAFGASYRNFLVNHIALGVKGSADLVAYFFLRAFSLVKDDGICGLLAVNTIAEGDTRQVGLERLISELGAVIYSAFPEEEWPGKAAVVTSRIHLFKGSWRGHLNLSGERVKTISAFLSDRDEWSPEKLQRNSGVAFIATYILGLGFTLLEDEAREMIAADPRNKEVLFRYLNGNDLNSNPNQTASRWVINFWDWSEAKAKSYPLPYDWILKKVKPERQRLKDNGDYVLRKPLPQRWWQYAEKRPALYHTIGRGSSFDEHPSNWDSSLPTREFVIGITRVSKFLNVALLPNDQIFTLDVIIFDRSDYGTFSILQSIIHELWVRKQSSTQETRLRYTPSDGFETFPMPEAYSDSLSEAGQTFYIARQSFLEAHNVGLTKFYNQFHDPAEQNGEIQRLRELQAELDQAVVNAYGWNDLEMSHGFLDVTYLSENDRTRYVINEGAQLEILVRLNLLNKRYTTQDQGEATLSEFKKKKTTDSQHGLKHPDLFISSDEDGTDTS